MTESEKNAISAGLLMFATATEMLMTEWLRMQNAHLTGESKMLIGGMKRGVELAKHYYSRFTEKVATVLYEDDKEMQQFDDMRRNAALMVRMYLHVLNLNDSGLSCEAAEKLLLDHVSEETGVYVSQDVIDKFRVQ